jgi:hypothetical protein
MEELSGRDGVVAPENEEDRPTLPYAKLRATSPDAITLPGTTSAPFFDVATAAFFAAGTAALAAANDTTTPTAEEEVAAWWAAQRRTSAARWVTALMALCVLLLAAGALRDAPADEGPLAAESP